MKFEIKNTKKYGVGVFATDLIKNGEIIFTLTGEKINEKDCDDMIAKGILNNDDPLQIDKDQYFILDKTSRSFNHSCDPNSGLKEESTLFALKDILPGEEITYDYSTTVYPYNYTFTTMTNCLCGSDNCRKKLGNVLSISKDTLNYYLEKGALQNYIITSLKDMGII